MVRVHGTHLNLTPVFKITVQSVAVEPWKRVTGAIQDGFTWYFPAYYPFGLSVFKDLKLLAPDAVWDETAKPFLEKLVAAEKAWKAALKAWESKQRIELPELTFPNGFEPYDHQRLGILMVHLWQRAFFLWEMGTGKTRTLIDGFRLSRREKKVQRALVLSPPVVLPTWVKEVERCSFGELVPYIWDGSDSCLDKAKKADVVVISYARARLEFQVSKPELNRLMALDYQCIVGDESHSIGNFDSLQTKAALALSSKAAYRYLLSGTAADHPGKLYPQLRFLVPSMLTLDWQKYQERFFVFSQFQKKQVVGYKNLADLNSRVDLIALRMKKKDCLDLPPVTFIDVPFDIAGDQQDAYDACIARLKDPELYERLFSGKGVNTVHGGALVTKLLQILSGFMIEGADLTICDGCSYLQSCVQLNVSPYTPQCQVYTQKPPSKLLRLSNPKQVMFKDLLSNILEADSTNKVIVWGTFLQELNDIEEVVKELGYGYVRIDGSNTSKIGEISDKFQTDEACRVYIGQVSSGVGVTLTAANYMVYYALTWNLTSYKQSLERNNRPGQTRKMVVYRLLSSFKGALDQFLAKMLAFKDVVAYTMLERIACSGCELNDVCGKKEIKPFQLGCKYKTEIDKPTATATYLGIPEEK